MQRVRAIARECDAQQLFEGEEILLTAGGSAIFDLVADQLKMQSVAPVRGLLRSGCYVTHDNGQYQRMMSAVASRMGCGHGLHAAIEVWAAVQSCPEPGWPSSRWASATSPTTSSCLCRSASASGRTCKSAPQDWQISGLNDQHAYLRGSGAQHQALRVGDLVALGISHPCTTFDKWRWMPSVDDALQRVRRHRHLLLT
jgi:D-serine dehydratase